ncbi:MAG: ribonuclease E/G, partial [Terriglobia bacterium]
MTKEMVISCSPHETKVALVEEGRVVEIYVEREKEYGLVGSIYKGRVTRVLPGMQSAFVDIGLDRDAFLYVSDFIEDLEDFERVTVAEVEEPETEPRTPEVPSPQPMAAGTEAGPAEAGPPPAPAEAQPELEERQPVFDHAQPPLVLPETRPRGRSRRHRHRRHRGGRRPGRPERGPRPEARREAAPETFEPIILPGESLAKYRHRTPPPPSEPNPTQPEDSASPPAPEPPSEPGNPDTSNGPIKSGDENLPEEPRRESPESDSAPVNSGKPEEPGPPPAPFQSSATEPEPPSPSPQEPAEQTPPTKDKEASAAAQESDPEVSTLAEIERGHRSENRVGLPPSLRERVAGGVEWERSRGRGPGPRGRRRHRHRGGRRRREEPRRPGPRRLHARPSRGQPAIARLLKAGQEIIVQIAKEQMGKKGARITSHVSLPGRFLVYMPTINHVGVSRKIGTAEERARLRRLLHELKGNITGGFVVRTAATGCSEDDLREDIDYLVKLWHDIRV